MTKHIHVERTEPTVPTQLHNFRRFCFQTEFYSLHNCCKLVPPVARSIHLFSQFDLLCVHRITHIMMSPIYHIKPVVHEFFSCFKLLRVLAICNTHAWFQSFPLAITKLFHLRYLQVQFDGDIPESISALQNLQTLICNGGTCLPRKIWTMKNLRHICMKEPSCLPSPRTEHVVTGMPNLEEFSDLSHASCTKEVFCVIPNLKRLVIRSVIICAPFFVPNQSLPRFFDMSILTKLEVLKLYAPPSLEDPFKRLVFPTSLRKLSLKCFCSFDWADISSTAMRLPNLEELKLKYFGTDRQEWRLCDEDKFENLKFLVLDDVNLKRWNASSDNFPNLKRLVLKSCRRLRRIPTDFGGICTLESIELHGCSTTAEDSARNIAQQQENMGNDIFKVIIHKSRGRLNLSQGTLC